MTKTTNQEELKHQKKETREYHRDTQKVKKETIIQSEDTNRELEKLTDTKKNQKRSKANQFQLCV
jgi:hypothetical protein